jgi:hypothetical protein
MKKEKIQIKSTNFLKTFRHAAQHIVIYRSEYTKRRRRNCNTLQDDNLNSEVQRKIQNGSC